MIRFDHPPRAWHAVADMWSCPTSATPADLSAGRPSLVVSEGADRVLLNGTYDTLPVVGNWCDATGCGWKRLELPAPIGEAIAEGQDETFSLAIEWSSGWRSSLDVAIRNGTPHPGHDEELDEAGGDNASRSPWVAAGEHALRMIGEHVDWIKRLVDRPTAGHRCACCDEPWSRRAGGLAAPSLHHAIEEWKVNRRDEPRLAVIVEIARKRESLIKSICHRPRRVLSRSRETVGLSRVQELDSGCLRWLARQPGRTVAERAGVRQRVLGVVRIESAETPENRVAKDFLRRAIMACARYQREYRDFPNHDRVQLVSRFRRTLGGLLRNSEISGVQPLVGVAQPNYVLQHDSRYRALWDEYVRLVREQTVEDEVWRWQHRLWAEVCAIGTHVVLSGWCPQGCALRSELWLRSEQNKGQFVHPLSIARRWQLRHDCPIDGGGIVDVVNGCMLEEALGGASLTRYIWRDLKPLCPDFALLRRTESDVPTTIVPIWTVFDFDIVENGLASRALSLSRHLSGMQHDIPVRGLILQPGLPASATGAEITEEKCCLGARLPLPVQSVIETLELLLSEVLACHSPA